jgi:hypothetical protein
LVFTCRLAGKILQEYGYFGGSVLVDYLACPSHKFAALFPLPGGQVPGIYFEDRIPPGQPDKATWTDEVDWAALCDPQGIVASAMLDQLRHITGARIDFEKLLQAVTWLAKDNYLEATW